MTTAERQLRSEVTRLAQLATPIRTRQLDHLVRKVDDYVHLRQRGPALGKLRLDEVNVGRIASFRAALIAVAEVDQQRPLHLE